MGKCCSNSEVEILLAFKFFDAEDRELCLVSLSKMLGNKYHGIICLLLISHAFVVGLAVSLNFNLCCYP